MSNVAICLGAKSGDICNFLAVARHLSFVNKERIVWFVHAKFEPVLQGVSYVDPVRITSDLVRPDLSFKKAQSLHPNVINGVSWGKGYIGDKSRPYNFMSWVNAGFGDDFHDVDGYPLVFDQRDSERERELLESLNLSGKPIILLHLNRSKSSPFSHAAHVEDRVRRRFGKFCQIIDLSQIRCVRIYDMLALFDLSKVLITVDSAFLHLATASPSLAKICLVNPVPFLGSACRYKPLLRLNYNEVATNLGAISQAISGAL